MYFIVFGFLVLLFLDGFVIVNEEVLIILAGVIWSDATGNISKSVFTEEVILKISKIESIFIWCLSKKTYLFRDLITLYVKKTNFFGMLGSIKERVLQYFIYDSVFFFFFNYILLIKYYIYIIIYDTIEIIALLLCTLDIAYVYVIGKSNIFQYSRYGGPEYFLQSSKDCNILGV